MNVLQVFLCIFSFFRSGDEGKEQSECDESPEKGLSPNPKPLAVLEDEDVSEKFEVEVDLKSYRDCCLPLRAGKSCRQLQFKKGTWPDPFRQVNDEGYI